MADIDPLSVVCPDCYAPAGTACYHSGGADYGPHAARVRSAELRAVEHGTCSLCGRPMVRGLDPVDAWHPDVDDAALCPPLPDPRTDWNGYATAINAGLSPGHPGLEHFLAPGHFRTLHAPATREQTDDPHTWGTLCGLNGYADNSGVAFTDLPDHVTCKKCREEEGRRLASERDDLIAAGVDPADLLVPLAPGEAEARVSVSITGDGRVMGLSEMGVTQMGTLYVCPECRAGKHQNCDGAAWDNDKDAPAPCACAALDHPAAS